MKTKIAVGIYISIMAVIIVLASRSDTVFLFRFVHSLPFGDKIGHFVVMGIFSFLLNLALRARTFRIWRIDFLLGTVIVAILVTIEEFSQIFVKLRTFDLIDLCFDFAGILLFGELARWIVRRAKN